MTNSVWRNQSAFTIEKRAVGCTFLLSVAAGHFDLIYRDEAEARSGHFDRGERDN